MIDSRGKFFLCKSKSDVFRFKLLSYSVQNHPIYKTDSFSFKG